MTPLIQNAVNEKIRNCLLLVEKAYGRTFNFPQVSYSIRGRVAGRAWPTQWKVGFNPVFMNEQFQDMIEDTVPHEIAHLIDRAVYGVQYTVGRKHKRISHGETWKSVMRVLGVDPKRTHNYNCDNAKVKTNTKTKFAYFCSCKPNIIVGPVVHKKIQGGARYTCKRCHGPITLVGNMGKVSYADARAKAVNQQAHTPPVTTTPKQKSSVTYTKMERAIEIYAIHNGVRSRIIDAFMRVLDMTTAGANTYFYNIKRKESK